MSPEDGWWDEECRQGIKQKNIARIKCLQQKTRTNQEHYKEKWEGEREREGQIKVLLDYNKICDNTCQRNMSIKRIYETKTINNWRKILRRIFGHTKDWDGTWRTEPNDELNDLIRKKNKINYIKTKD
jgi:hypothetical protein